MPLSFLGQGDLTPIQRGVRDHFIEGGSILTAALVLAFCLLMVGFVYVVTRRMAIRSGTTPSGKQLFRLGLDGVSLSAPQRMMLSAVAIAERVENPAVLLLSRPLFDQHVDRWLGLKDLAQIDDKTRSKIQTARELRAALFPPR